MSVFSIGGGAVSGGGQRKNLEESAVLWNRKTSPGYCCMGIACRPSFEDAAPGQFVMVRLKSQAQPLLRRPFSIHDLIRTGGRVSGFEILYKIVGPGTEKLAACRPDDTVDVLGPLGRGFSLPSGAGRVYVAAGGVGVAPFVFLTKVLLEKGVDGSGITLFLGGRSSADLPARDYFEKAGVELRLATDDGSLGERGPVTLPLERALRRKKPEILYACGPAPMLRAVADLAADAKTRCELSIETMMACGMGACLGCAVESRLTDTKYLHACIDGPVFAAGDIRL